MGSTFPYYSPWIQAQLWAKCILCSCSTTLGREPDRARRKLRGAIEIHDTKPHVNISTGWDITIIMTQLVRADTLFCTSISLNEASHSRPRLVASLVIKITHGKCGITRLSAFLTHSVIKYIVHWHMAFRVPLL